MVSVEIGHDEFRVLVLAPVGRDGALVCQILRQAGMAAEPCADLSELCGKLREGAGVALLTEEALQDTRGLRLLMDQLQAAPTWSDLPLVVLGSARSGEQAERHLGATLGMTANVTLLERPLRPWALTSTIHSAIRARKRQFEVRDHLRDRQRAEEDAEKSRQRLAGIVDSAMDAIITVDETQRIVLFNPAAERMFRCPVAEALGVPVDRFIPQRFREVHRRHIEHFGQTGETARAMGHLGAISGLRADGEAFPIEASISQVQVSGKKLFTVILRDITERRETERRNQELTEALKHRNAELDAERARWQGVVEGIADEVWVCDVQGRMGLMNLPDMTQMGLDEFQDRSVQEVLQELDILYPDGQPRPPEQTPLLRSLRGEIVRGEELMRNRRTGRERHRQFSSAPTRDATGAITGAVAIVRDITELRKAQEALREALREAEEGRRLLEALMEHIPMGITIADAPDAKIRSVSRYGRELTGRPREQLEGIPVDLHTERWEIYRADGVTPARNEDLPLTRATQKGEIVREEEWVVGRADGTRVPILCTAAPILDSQGNVAGGVIGWQDITERKRNEEAIRTREADLARAQAAAHLGSWRWDLIHDVVSWSEELFRIFGVDPKTFVPSNDAANNLIHPDDRALHRELVAVAMAGTVVATFEFRIVRPSGEERIVLASGFEVEFDATGKPILLFGTILDITERKRAEEELKRLKNELELRVEQRTSELAAANRDLEAFAYTVSHDLRAPLRHVGAFLELLDQHSGPALDEEGREYLQIVSASAQRMGSLIDDLLGLSRLGRAALTETDVNVRQLVDEAIQELAPQTDGRTIDWQINSLPLVRGDRILLRSAVVNLLSNAIKYTRHRDLARIEIGSREQEGETIFWVRDNGAGFEMRFADKLFGVFQRLHPAQKFEGTGIGLASVRRIIERHGGRTWAEGAVDRGATFYFSLPSRR